MTTLGETNTTVEYLVEKIQEQNEKKVNAKKYEVKVIGEETGFMCCIFQIKVEWEEECNLPKSFIAKILKVGKGTKHFDRLDFSGNKEAEEMRSDMMTPEGMAEFQNYGHHTEIEAFKFLGPDPPLTTPRVFYSQEWEPEKNLDGIIAMEDFVGATAMANMPDGLNLNQVLSIAEQLAKLHAYCFDQKPGWDTKFMNEELMKMMESRIAYFKHVASTLIKYRPNVFGDLIPKLDHLYSKEAIMGAQMAHMGLGIPSILVHGDLWTSNILWKKDQSGGLSDHVMAIIDWQMVHPGNPMEDLGRILATSVPHQLRREKIDQILQHYHKCLVAKMGKEPFSFEKLQKAYKAVVPYIVLGTTFGVPLWLNIPDVVGEGDTKARRTEEMLDRTQAFIEDYLAEKDS